MSAAILVGGVARRFGGRSKAALVVEGRRIIDRQLDALRTVTDDVILVGSRSDELPAARNPSKHPVRHVADWVPGCGPLGGLDAALEAVSRDILLILACDMPFVTPELLLRLAAGVGPADAAVPRTKHGYHPLCAAYSRRCKAAVRRRLDAHRLSMAGLLEELRVNAIEGGALGTFGDPERLLTNVNTAAEYDRVTRLSHP